MKGLPAKGCQGLLRGRRQERALGSKARAIEVIANERTAPRDKIAAAKLVSDVAGGSHGAVGVKSGFNLKIDLGKRADGSRCGIDLRDITLYPRG